MENLKNYFLIATPALHDTFWAEGVIYICQHDPIEGTMGMLINQPSTDITFNEVAKELDIKPLKSTQPLILTGGPVESHRGFVLHDEGYRHEDTLDLAPRVHLTATPEIVEKIADGTAPQNFNFCLGYAGWDAGQLEEEIAENNWLMLEADTQILYQTPATKRYQACLDKLGVDSARMSAISGHA